MINYRGRPRRMIASLRQGLRGGRRRRPECSKFGWMDPEGNRIELWQPPA
jgi:hypothetical protein